MMTVHIKLLAAATVSVVALAACSDAENRPSFDGVSYRTKASAVDRKTTRAFFEAEVLKVGAAATGAREAMRFAGTTYCIENYGTSKIDWQVDLDDPEAPLPRSGDTLVLRGTCNP